MSGQYEMDSVNKSIIMSILDELGIDPTETPVSIHISSYEDDDETEPELKTNIYVEVN